MSEEILSLAVLEAFEGKQEQLVQTLREFYAMMQRKGYSHDTLHRDSAHPERFLHMRRWVSEAMREEAHNDPEVHRYWQMLPELCKIPRVYEKLETVFEN